MTRAASSLADVRKRSGRSQAEVASSIGTTQSGVSRIERQSDIRLSTLDEYVVALGGRLRLVVELDSGEVEMTFPLSRQAQPAARRREFRVIWQAPKARSLIHVGWLEYTGEEFVYSYTDDAKANSEFEPFAAFPTLTQSYRSTDLFPYFAVRLTSAADPTFNLMLDALGLTRVEATPLELLARSPSESPHDTIQVVPEPVEQPDGSLVRTFLVSGVRHADENSDEVARLVEGLLPGTALDFIPEPDNDFNARALRLSVGGRFVGWVPDYLLDEVHAHLEAGHRLAFTVERANGPGTPWHLRLLCRLTVSPVQNTGSSGLLPHEP